MYRLESNSKEQTLEIGYKLGKLLSPFDVVCLDGDLGAGKTLFSKGIAQSLGITEHITSPTFTVVNEYNSSVPLFHFDVYRIADSDDILDIGFEDYLNRGGITIIEWASMIKDIIPKQNIEVLILKNNNINEDFREVKIVFNGTKYNDIKQSFEIEMTDYLNAK